jgi:hypothetical protein
VLAVERTQHGLPVLVAAGMCALETHGKPNFELQYLKLRGSVGSTVVIVLTMTCGCQHRCNLRMAGFCCPTFLGQRSTP